MFLFSLSFVAHLVYSLSSQLAIGNAPWPVGVTMVGIHARAGREKIETNKIAHVMNDECMRKYLTVGIKRLISFAQRRFPPVDAQGKSLPSLMVK